MLICPNCGAKNQKDNFYCSECGENLKLSKEGNFSKKAIIFGIISWIPLFIIWAAIYSLLLQNTLSAYDYAYTLGIVQFLSSFIAGYSAGKLYIRSAILIGLIVSFIFSGLFILLGGIPTVFLTIIIFGGLGGFLGGYIKIQKEFCTKRVM